MSARVYGRLTFLTTRRAIGALAGLVMVCLIGFNWRCEKLGGKKTLDAWGWHTPEEANEILGALGESGRALYATTEVTLDAVFPVAYASLFAGLIGNLYSFRAARGLVTVPVGAALADAVENGTAAYLAWSFSSFNGSLPEPVVAVGSTATVIKWSLTVLAVLLIVAGSIRCMWPGAGAERP